MAYTLVFDNIINGQIALGIDGEARCHSDERYLTIKLAERRWSGNKAAGESKNCSSVAAFASAPHDMPSGIIVGGVGAALKHVRSRGLS